MFELTNSLDTFEENMDDILHPYLLEKNQFYARISKCIVFGKEVEYLCHIISKEGVEVKHSKIKAIKEWIKPRNISKLRKFVKNYEKLTTSLSNLLKKNVFEWSTKAEEYFVT